jgi:hypothetical protein
MGKNSGKLTKRQISEEKLGDRRRGRYSRVSKPGYIFRMRQDMEFRLVEVLRKF